MPMPPNEPGPDGQGGAGQTQPERQVDQEAGGGLTAGGIATAAKLGAFFPEHRRTRLAQVAQLVQSLEASGTVTSAVLLAAAASQAAVLGRDAGKAAPSMLRWLRERRWLDTAMAAPASQSVPANWRDGRSGIEAMGVQVGLGAWDSDRWRLFSDYEREVVALVEAAAHGVPA